MTQKNKYLHTKIKNKLIEIFSKPDIKDIEMIQSFKDKHKNEKGIIIANGPSLKEINLDLLKNIPTIGMNRIYMLYDKFEFRPTYYCIEDRLEAEAQCDIIHSLNNHIILIPKYLSYGLKKEQHKNIIYTHFLVKYNCHKKA